MKLPAYDPPATIHFRSDADHSARHDDRHHCRWIAVLKPGMEFLSRSTSITFKGQQPYLWLLYYCCDCQVRRHPRNTQACLETLREPYFSSARSRSVRISLQMYRKPRLAEEQRGLKLTTTDPRENKSGALSNIPSGFHCSRTYPFASVCKPLATTTTVD